MTRTLATATALALVLTLTALPATAGTQMWMYAVPAQVDGRHGIDLLVGSKGNGATVGWLEAPPDARDLDAWKFHSLYKAGWIMSLVARDLDADGDADVIVSDRKGPSRGLLWLEHPGRKQVTGDWPEHRIGADGDGGAGDVVDDAVADNQQRREECAEKESGRPSWCLERRERQARCQQTHRAQRNQRCA